MISMRWSTQFCAALAIVGALCATDGCRREAAGGAAGKTAQNDSLRIISLSPAISRTLVDFGLAGRVVGRTPHCDALDRSIPVIGDLINVDYEQIIRLNPTHILVQPPASGADPHLLELAKQRGWKVGQWHLNGRDDIEQMVRELPGTLFSDGSPQLAAATSKSAEILNSIAQALSPGVQPLFRGRTLMVSAVDPVMVFGTDTYLHDVLIAVGGSNATSARGWAQLSLEDVARLDPEAIIIVKPGADPKVGAIAAAGPLKDLNVAAVRNRRVGLLTHPDAFTPSSGIIGVAGEMRALLQSFAESTP